MKRILSLLLSLCLLLGLCACGGSRAENSGSWQEQYDLGIRYLSEGNYEEAILAFEAAIKIDPKRPEAYIKTAEAYVSAGDLDAAIAVLEQGAQATGDEELKAYLERLQAGPLTALAYQAAYEPDGTLCWSQRYSYNGAGYLTQIETHYAESVSSIPVSIERWEYIDNSGRCIRIPPRRQNETDAEWESRKQEQQMQPGTNHSNQSVGDIWTRPDTREEVGEDGVLECFNRDPNSSPFFDYAVYTFDEAGYPLTITTYGYEGEIIGTAVLEWITVDPAVQR